MLGRIARQTGCILRRKGAPIWQFLALQLRVSLVAIGNLFLGADTEAMRFVPADRVTEIPAHVERQAIGKLSRHRRTLGKPRGREVLRSEQLPLDLCRWIAGLFARARRHNAIVAQVGSGCLAAPLSPRSGFEA